MIPPQSQHKALDHYMACCHYIQELEENLALDKNSWQTSVYSSYKSSYANDGNFDVNLNQKIRQQNSFRYAQDIQSSHLKSRKDPSSIESKIVDPDRLNNKRRSGSVLSASFHSKVGFGFDTIKSHSRNAVQTVEK